MSISSLRWRAASALIMAGAVAAAVLGLVVPAGASTGTAEISPEQAGYTATGAQFKNIVADVFLRQPAQYSGEVGGFAHSVQLWSSDLVVTLGATAADAGYTGYATIYDRSTHTVIASDPARQFCDPHGNCGLDPFPWQPGSTLVMRIGYSPQSGQLRMSATDADGSSFSSSYTAAGQSFTQARVGTEFGSDPWTAPLSYTPPAHLTKIAAYSFATLTTYSGHDSTLWSWWVHHKLLANTGQQSGADWVAVPTDLTNGGANFQISFVPQSGQRRAPAGAALAGRRSEPYLQRAVAALLTTRNH